MVATEERRGYGSVALWIWNLPAGLIRRCWDTTRQSEGSWPSHRCWSDETSWSCSGTLKNNYIYIYIFIDPHWYSNFLCSHILQMGMGQVVPCTRGPQGFDPHPRWPRSRTPSNAALQPANPHLPWSRLSLSLWSLWRQRPSALERRNDAWWSLGSSTMANWMESLGLSYTLVNVNVNQLNM